MGFWGFGVLGFIAVTIFGMSFLVDLTDLSDHNNETYNDDQWLSVGPHKYITGSLIAFSGIEACESYVASLMSKVVPCALAVGTFNSGLLATLVGTVSFYRINAARPVYIATELASSLLLLCILSMPWPLREAELLGTYSLR